MQHLDQPPRDKIPVVLAENGQLARLVLHRSVPHVRRIDWTDQTDSCVLLQHGKHGGIGGISIRNSWVIKLFLKALWLE